MALSILNNIASLEAQNQLATTNMKLQNVLFQLSSGSKINSGADDPAGLSIADGLQANISALAQSAQNVSDGVGMLQTADGALSQVTTLLNRAVTLATQAANSGLTQGVGGQQAALQNEFQSITNEVNQIGSNTTYNNNAVFTGGNMSVFLSDGSAADSADPNIYVAMPNLSAASLGLSSYVTGTLDLTNNPTAGNTVKIGSQTYKFVAAGQANAAGDVALGNGVQSTLQNLQAAVNGSPGAGNTYGAGTTPNTLATIISANGGSAVVQALNAGSTGNSVELSTNLTSTVGAAGGGTALSGGVNATSSTGTLTLNAQPGVISTATATLTMTAVPDTITNATGVVDFGATQPTAGNATGTLTLLNGVPADGDTVTVGNTTYQFEATMASANDVKIGVDIATTLQNLQAAVNGTGSAGTEYFAGTTTAGTAMITDVNVGTGAATVVSVAPDATGNNVDFSTNFATQPNVTATGAGKLAGGVASDTITVGSQAYTFVAAGAAVTGNEVALGATLADTMTNLMNAVNGTGTAGDSTYSTGAAAVGNATMSYSGSGGLATITAAAGGTGGNSIALSSTITGAANPTGTLSGGAAADTVTVGNQTYTFVAAGQATQANEVSVGATVATTLANLKAAVNGIGTGSNTTYGVGTTSAATYATIGAILNGVATVTAATAGAGAAGAGGTGTGMNVQLATNSSTNTFAASALSGGTAADTVTIGNVSYTFVAAGTATTGNTVALGTGGTAAQNLAQTLTNLKNAVNASATGAGANGAYNVATLNTGASLAINPQNADQAILTALTSGANTTTVLTGTFAGGANTGAVSGSGDLAGGTAATASAGNLLLNSNPMNGNTVTIGSTTYTFVTSSPTAANQVLINASSINGTLNNLKDAVDLSGGAAGVNYGAGTVANSAVTITINGNQATVTSATTGSAGNSITLSANLANGAGGGTVGTVASNLSGGGASVDLSAPTNAQAALTTIAAAIAKVASERGAIGAGINQMNAALTVMTNTSQNLTSSLSGIRDANIGQVVANMSKYQVLEQTGIAALAQANSQNQAVLKLLQ